VLEWQRCSASAETGPLWNLPHHRSSRTALLAWSACWASPAGCQRPKAQSSKAAVERTQAASWCSCDRQQQWGSRQQPAEWVSLVPIIRDHPLVAVAAQHWTRVTALLLVTVYQHPMVAVLAVENCLLCP